jgi:DNA transposition AAA+ family ATPase
MMNETDPKNGEPDTDRQVAMREGMDRLNDNNRILRAARMLNENRPLTRDEIKGVVSQFLHYTAENNIPHRYVARQCGYSISVISCWAGGTYKGDVEGVTRTVNNWMERDSRRRESRRPKDYIATQVAEDIRTTVYLADKRSCMAAIVVPAGAGKTMVAKALCQEMRGIYVYADEHITSRELYRSIAAEVGWDNKLSSRGDLLRFIVSKLNGSGRVIFVDEAQNIGKHLGCLRSIFDRAGTPIVMLGTDEIMRHLNDRSHGRGQFSSRTIRYSAMDCVANVEGGPGNQAGRDLFTLEEVQALFAMKKIRIDREGMKLLWALACLPNYGTLRLIEAIVDTAIDQSPDRNVVTRDDVVSALKLLVGGEAGHLQMLARRHVDLLRSEPTVAKAG